MTAAAVGSGMEEFGAFGGIGRIAIGAGPVRAVRSDVIFYNVTR